MIEVIYKEEKQEAKNGENIFSLPKNIRQIGFATGGSRIYIEDYVYTFLGRLSASGLKDDKEKTRIAVLTGETRWNDGLTYIFIRGALMTDKMEAAVDHIDFSEKTWSEIQENQEKYFPGQEITGWFFSHPQIYLESNEMLNRVHLRYFGGETVLMLMEPVEREDAFFCYENGFMVRQRGYYIYYEKNPLMQEYMIGKKEQLCSGITEQVEDEAVASFRKIIKNKKMGETEEEPRKETEHTSVFSYAATACLVLAVLAAGAGVYRNYNRIKGKSQKNASVTTSGTIRGRKESTISGTPETQKPTETLAVQESSDEGQQEVQSVYTEESDETWSKYLSEEYDKKNDSTEAENVDEMGTADETEKAGWEKNTYGVNGTGEDMNSPGEENNIENEAPSADIAQSSAGTFGNVQGMANAENSTAQDLTGEFSQESDTRKEKRNQEANAASSDRVHETYIIKPGDTLYQISLSRYGTLDAIVEICELNHLTENQIIYPGQMIVLP